jgi:hypothetical protein
LKILDKGTSDYITKTVWDTVEYRWAPYVDSWLCSTISEHKIPTVRVRDIKDLGSVTNKAKVLMTVTQCWACGWRTQISFPSTSEGFLFALLLDQMTADREGHIAKAEWVMAPHTRIFKRLQTWGQWTSVWPARLATAPRYIVECDIP